MNEKELYELCASAYTYLDQAAGIFLTFPSARDKKMEMENIVNELKEILDSVTNKKEYSV